MAERRSLVAGVEATPPGVDHHMMRAFIHQESPVAVEPSSLPAEAPIEEKETHAATASRQERDPASRVAKPAPPKKPKVSVLHATLLVPVTVRLRPEIAGALKRASLQRQLNGIGTYTQQDIVEDALVPWLACEGLLE